MNASDRRQAAIASTVRNCLDDKYKLRQDISRADIVAAIQSLAPLGRTQRWSDALNAWERMVDDSTLDMDWALLQGQVYAVHAA